MLNGPITYKIVIERTPEGPKVRVELLNCAGPGCSDNMNKVLASLGVADEVVSRDNKPEFYLGLPGALADPTAYT
jgi:hypothetical protein